MYTYNVKPPTLFTLQEEQDKVREVVADVNEKVLLMLNDCSEESREVIVNLRAFFVDTVFEKFSLKDDGSGALIKYFFQREEVKKEDGETGERPESLSPVECFLLKSLKQQVLKVNTRRDALNLGYTFSRQGSLSRDQVFAVVRNHIFHDSFMEGYNTILD